MNPPRLGEMTMISPLMNISPVMKISPVTNISRFKRLRFKRLVAATTLAVLLAPIAFAEPQVTERIVPEKISLGEAAQLTIATSGSGAPDITPPMVAGLEFVAVGQSQRIESINGVTRSSTSITYQVIPRQAGIFTIPGMTPGSPPLVLTVNPGGGGSAAPSGGSAPSPAPNAAAGSQLPGGSTRLAADGSAFVRLRLTKHQLYVGEAIPVDIQVGTRDGVVASLNGPPMLNGDAFTLEKLSSQPDRSQEIIDGKPFTVFTWHSALAAVKPGDLSLTMETPLTVRIRRALPPDGGLFGNAGLDDLFNDPAFQNFFGASTEKEITVASTPAEFKVLELPALDRPAEFSGAVGHFTVSSELSDNKAAAGDPVTLRLHVSGTGNFDRVNTRMLHDVDHWKTYAPTAKFKPDDEIGYRGEKTFEQPIIATQPGTEVLPALEFSWFDPTTGHYVQARTSPLTVAITPAAADTSLASAAAGASNSTTAITPATNSATNSATNPSANTAPDALRPDHVDSGRGSDSLRPHYFQPPYLAIPSALLVALFSAWFGVHRREQRARDLESAARRNDSLQTEPLLKLMDEASVRGDSELFFRSARTALQRNLASKWLKPPDSVSLEDVDARLGAGSVVARVFKLADEAAYSGLKLSSSDFQRWKQLIIRQISGGETVA